MEEKTLDDEQYGSEEQQETKGFGDMSAGGCRWYLVSQVRGTAALKEVPE